MIKKIASIKNLAVFRDFKWDSSVLDSKGGVVPFSKVNVLYGRNYSGKTTLSRIVRAFETGAISDKYDSPEFAVTFDDGSSASQQDLLSHGKTVRVFNEDFVRDNLRCITNPEDSVTPFAVVVGEDNSKVELAIKTLEDALGSDQTGKETGLYAQLIESNKKLNTAIAEQIKASGSLEKQLSDKATNRETGIKYRPDRFGDLNYTKVKLESDIKVVLAENYRPLSADRQVELEQVLRESVKSPIPEIERPRLSIRDLAREAQGLIEKKIGDSGKIAELARDAVLNEWVKKGYELHDDARLTCAFCGNEISEDRWAMLRKHFDEESRVLETSIASLTERANSHRESVRSGFPADKTLFYAKFAPQVEELISAYSTAAEKYVGQVDLLVGQLQKRIKSITTPFTFGEPQDYSSELSDVFTKYEALRKDSNEFTRDLSKEQDEARRLLRLHEVAGFARAIGYGDVRERIRKLGEVVESSGKARDAVQSDIQGKQKDIRSNRAKLSDEEKGAERVNQYLSSHFGHGFLSLQAVIEGDAESKKTRFEIIRNGIKAYHLSEGECSLIAFCYFVAKLDDTNTRGTKPIIWIDDPVSSLDGNHIFFLYSLIAAKIIDTDSFEQVFVSTHNLDFLRYLKRIGNPDQRSYLLVHRERDTSSIQLMPKYMKDYVTEFNYLFHEIYKCSCMETPDDTNYASLCGFGNNARKFLEVYLYFRYPDSSTYRVRMERFFGAGKVPLLIVGKVTDEYSHLEEGIERALMPVEVPEARAVAQLILRRIKENDEEQYAALVNSLPSETSR